LSNEAPEDERTFTMVYREESEGGYSAQCLELPAAITQGETLDELEENMKDAINLVLESIKDKAEKEHDKVMAIKVSSR
jgi:predicted RNase H-like HicB family nuclease